LFGDCLGLALTQPKKHSGFLVVPIEFVSKSRIGFSTHSVQSSSSYKKGRVKDVKRFAQQD